MPTSSNIERVIVAKPRGFCAGVEMAIKALAFMVRAFPPPVYCYHEIVHNQKVVDQFREHGVIFVDNIEEVPPGAPVMLSAHGSSPEVVKRSQELGGFVVDAVCPLVTKVHHELKVRASKGYTVLYVGHDGHDEAVGTMAVAPSSSRLVQTVDDVDKLADIETPVALLAQTTLAHSEWSEIQDRARDRFPEMWMPLRSDLCFATTNRQAAVRDLAQKVNALIVIGSENSSNTIALEKTARESGVAEVFRVNDVRELPDNLSGVIGVTAGASAPEQLVQEIIEFLAPTAPVDELVTTNEDEYFPVPRELRELNVAIAELLSFAWLGNVESVSERAVGASQVLTELNV